MDTKKIGSFLAQLRHEKKLTQEQLGEIIGTTNKTISRWENGNYLPPVEALQQLSKYYNISINEILSGQRLTETQYKEKAEVNIKKALTSNTFTLQERIDYFKTKWIQDNKLTYIVEMILIVILIILAFVFNFELKLLTLLLPFILVIVKRNQMMAYIEKNAYKNIDKTE